MSSRTVRLERLYWCLHANDRPGLEPVPDAQAPAAQAVAGWASCLCSRPVLSWLGVESPSTVSDVHKVLTGYMPQGDGHRNCAAVQSLSRGAVMASRWPRGVGSSSL